MGYRSYDQMFANYNSIYMLEMDPLYSNEHGESLTDQQLRDDMVIYGRSSRTRFNFLVIGRKARQRILISRQRGIVEQMGVSTPEVPIIDLSVVNNLKPINESDGKRGSILDSDRWTFLMNDLSISGGYSSLHLSDYQFSKITIETPFNFQFI